MERFEDSQNPIDDLDENNIINKDYFSDPHLVFYKDTLECWYRISHQKIMLLIYYANILSMKDWSPREVMINLQDTSIIKNETGNMVISLR